MDRMKTLTKYVLWLVGFFILSTFLINVGLNSNYKKIDSINDNTDSRIDIYQAEATLVNGRLRGIITNNTSEDISGKYIKLDLYSKRDNHLGTRYIDIGQVEKDKTIPIELYFKVSRVASYEVSLVDEKTNEGDLNIELISEDLKKPEIILATIFTVLIFWG